jgi:hypothetical protein
MKASCYRGLQSVESLSLLGRECFMKPVAILFDAAFWFKRYRTLQNYSVNRYPQEAAVDLAKHAFEYGLKHINSLNLKYIKQIAPRDRDTLAAAFEKGIIPPYELYRMFFYDAPPWTATTEYPITKRQVHFGKNPTSILKQALYEALAQKPNMALRLGELSNTDKGWVLNQTNSRH